MRRHFNKNTDFNILDYIGRKPLRTNAVTPEIFVGPVWPHDEPPTVEIIELNSSDETEITPRPTNDTMCNAWSYINDHDLEKMEDNYKINKNARERRRVEIENNKRLLSPDVSKNSNNHNEKPNSLYNNDSEDKLRFNNQMNCFTIINKHVIDSDTSTEGGYGEVEIITSSDILLGTGGWDTINNNYYDEEMLTYDINGNQETRTVWIYSYKNKNLLSDDDIETNNPNKTNSSSSTSYSTDSSGDVKDKSAYSYRSGSPIPTTFIPRLDLSLVPTLSTVTEISENIQISPNKNNQKRNNWFSSESAKFYGSKPVQKEEKSTNIINWMALSPRERYRVLKDSGTSGTWVGSHLHLAEIHKQNKIGNHGDEEPNEITQQNDAVKIKVNADVHVNTSDNNENKAITLLNSGRVAIMKCNDTNNSIKDLKYVDTQSEDCCKDRGDHYTKSVIAPTIRGTPKHHKSINTTDSIEKLDSNNWIMENEEEKEKSTYNYELERNEFLVNDGNIDNTIDHIWIKNNVPFLKPSEWTEFVAIAESPISFHLSFGSVIEEKQSWFKRIINFINCCK